MLPQFRAELVYARNTMSATRQHFADAYFSVPGDIVCPRQLNRHTAQGINLMFLLGALLMLALLRDLLKVSV